MARAVDRDTAMGYHLWADTRHDFGASGPIYNIGGAGAPGVNTAPDGSGPEAQGLNYFLSGGGRGFITDLALRSPNQKTFAVPEKTSAFQSWTAPVLYATGNAAVGVIQDAGHYITESLGAENVLTFGSVLDPATKPAGAERNPIWFDPAVNAVRIPLAMFGFAPASIEALEVGGFAGGVAVSANYIIRDVPMDAIALGPTQPRPGVKPISRTEVGVAGFFTSIAKAENLPAELTASAMFTNDALARAFVTANREKFFIGKTLGDVTLVASAMQNFSGTPNPYTGIGTDGVWKDINGDELEAGPETLILKTGDQLNWVRAIVMGVGAIYEDQPKGSRSALQYKYFPALLTDEQLTASLINGFAAIVADVTTRYDGIIASLDGIIAGGAAGETINDIAIFAGEVQSVLTTDSGRSFGAKVVRQIQADLTFLRDTVVTWVNRRASEVTLDTTLPELRKLYEDTRVRANACTPTTSSIFVEKAGGPVIPMKVIVANVPPAAIVADPDWPLSMSIDIAMRMAFGKLNTASDIDRGLVGTDLKKRFFDKIEPLRPAPLGGQSGGAGPESLDLDAVGTIDPVLTASKLLTRINTAGGEPTGMEDPRFMLDDCPYIKGLQRYLAEKFPTNPNRAFGVAYNIAAYRGGYACIDESVATLMTAELESLSVRNAIRLTGAPEEETIDTLLFNAYVCCVNGRNSRGFGDREYNTQSEYDFRQLERAFMDVYTTKAATVITTADVAGNTALLERAKKLGVTDPEDILYMTTQRNPKDVYRRVTARKNILGKTARGIKNIKRPVGAYAPVERLAGGGLQTRRSLYTKHVGGSAPAPRRGLYAGLR